MFQKSSTADKMRLYEGKGYMRNFKRLEIILHNVGQGKNINPFPIVKAFDTSTCDDF